MSETAAPLDSILDQLPELPSELTSLSAQTLALAGAAVGAAILLFLFYRFMRRRKRASDKALPNERDIPGRLQRSHALCDLLMGPAMARALICRCVITKADKKGLECEIVEDFASESLEEGRPVLCTFKPVAAGKTRRNAFETVFQGFSKVKSQLASFRLSFPQAFTSVKRRQHKRMRVKDQQFVRTKLWVARHDADQTDYTEAAPVLAVNAFDMRAPGQDENAVVNISPGGLGVVTTAELLDHRLQPGVDVVANIFLFNFREKIFKPYWYAGKLRAMEEQGGGEVRLGLEFQRVGREDPETGRIHWEMV
ncbi:MAG: hypothetical protein ACOCVM_05520 [Desulfovibrionaceae bacterium]